MQKILTPGSFPIEEGVGYNLDYSFIVKNWLERGLHTFL